MRLLLVFVALLMAGTAQGQVSVTLSALDREGRPVEGLKAEDLRVTVEGQPQNLLNFMRRTEDPLHVVVMLDASPSQERVLSFARPAAASLLSVLLRPGKDDAAIVTFTNNVKVVTGLTADGETLARAIQSVEFVPPPDFMSGGVVVGRPKPNDPAPLGTTAIWDSLVKVCDEVLKPAAAGRRVIFLLTDGVDISSRLKPEKAAERLVREGVNVYSVGVGDSHSFDGVDEVPLKKISEQTGGRAFFPKTDKDFLQYLEQTRRELLEASYALTFGAPPRLAAGKHFKLRVEVVNPELRKRGVRLAYPQALLR